MAYVYVSSAAATSAASAASSTSGNQIQAFAASSSGALTPLAGSPFAGDVTQMAVSGTQLIAVNRNGYDLESYAVDSSGALTHEATTNTAIKSSSGQGNCNWLGPLFFDSTGTTVYDMENKGSGCANNTYVSFAVNGATSSSPGALTALGNSSANNWLSQPAVFTAGNAFAYTATCIDDMYWGIYGFTRASNGLLTEANIGAAPPKPPAGHFYCPSIAAADSANHVAIALEPVNQQTFTPDQPAQIAVYTADASGNLATASTAANMPATQVGTVNDLKIAPSGAFIAIAGASGLQVFTFNGANQLTAGTGLLTADSIDQCFWDGAGHLYALSSSAGKLHVFTVGASGAVEASGSPYAIGQPDYLAVVPIS